MRKARGTGQSYSALYVDLSPKPSRKAAINSCCSSLSPAGHDGSVDNEPCAIFQSAWPLMQIFSTFDIGCAGSGTSRAGIVAVTRRSHRRSSEGWDGRDAARSYEVHD